MFISTHLLIFAGLLKNMVLPLIMKTETKIKIRQNAKIYLNSTTKNQPFLKITAKAFEAADFLNIFLRFWGF